MPYTGIQSKVDFPRLAGILRSKSADREVPFVLGMGLP